MSFKYRDLAAAFSADIRAGKLADGQRLPSIRTLSRLHEVSITTALKTYELLEAEGYLTARPQAGFFVHHRPAQLAEPRLPTFRPLAAPVTNAELIHEIQQAANDPGRVQFGTVVLAPSLLPLDELQRSLIRAARRMPQMAGRYGPAHGEPALLDALCVHFAQDGIHLQPDELLITNGCLHALSLAIQTTTQPGDSIAVPSPCYSGQLQLLASLERKVVEIPSRADGIDIDSMETIVATGQVAACLLSANHQNPLGYCLSVDDKRRIAMLARRYRCPVIEDDVYGECSYGNERPLPVRSWDEEGYVLWCGSFSKTLAPSYRDGWCAPGRYGAAMRALQRNAGQTVNTPLQLALADFLRSGAYRRHLKRLRASLPSQVENLRASIARHFPAGCSVTRPQGGYALWVQLPEGCDGLALYEAAKEKGINIVPGTVFSTEDRYRGCVRLNAGNPWSEELDWAAQLLGTLIGT